MGFHRRRSVESKDLELLVVGGETGVRVCESCKGKMRSILLDRDELAWLVSIYEDLVVVEDSRVFWNQSQPGFPWIIAQHCFNRHGGFLVVEEFIDDRRSGSVLIQEVEPVKAGRFLAWSYGWLLSTSEWVAET
jgi:hypothetical protein